MQAGRFWQPDSRRIPFLNLRLVAGLCERRGALNPKWRPLPFPCKHQNSPRPIQPCLNHDIPRDMFSSMHCNEV